MSRLRRSTGTWASPLAPMESHWPDPLGRISNMAFPKSGRYSQYSAVPHAKFGCAITLPSWPLSPLATTLRNLTRRRCGIHSRRQRQAEPPQALAKHRAIYAHPDTEMARHLEKTAGRHPGYIIRSQTHQDPLHVTCAQAYERSRTEAGTRRGEGRLPGQEFIEQRAIRLHNLAGTLPDPIDLLKGRHA